MTCFHLTLPNCFNKINATAALPDATKEVKKKRRKDALVLDFENPPDFGVAFNPAKGTSKLTHATLTQWLPEKVTLPEDLNFDVKEFTQYVLIAGEKSRCRLTFPSLEQIVHAARFGRATHQESGLVPRLGAPAVRLREQARRRELLPDVRCRRGRRRFRQRRPQRPRQQHVRRAHGRFRHAGRHSAVQSVHRGQSHSGTEHGNAALYSFTNKPLIF